MRTCACSDRKVRINVGLAFLLLNSVNFLQLFSSWAIWFGHNMFILQYIILGVQNLCVTTLLANCGNYCSASHNAWWQIFETKDQAILFTIKTGFEFPKMAHCKLKIWSILTWKLKCVRVHVAGERQIWTFTYSTVQWVHPSAENWEP